jgi:hypothetical protein
MKNQSVNEIVDKTVDKTQKAQKNRTKPSKKA